MRLLLGRGMGTGHLVCIRRIWETGTDTSRAVIFLDTGTMLLEPEQE
ncbi:MAG TPA: hypothetical protein PLI82_12805 [Candidatus Sumerlaeota bacterium]|nr:hypothetical protein [Candidatus Sumerlaeota bacterium]HON51453.1 hypothetical protein [Candidatus Sumerlaeota bacterium]HQH12177.1 hypothetical protein [Candidatus Sumerlaeota bacterium]HRR30155.1 hypothetical protein [Candidatus Sumerlaeia bacterium]HRU53615.1 hypothetical protein [Candidatus Sumerlaeia bacterium]